MYELTIIVKDEDNVHNSALVFMNHDSEDDAELTARNIMEMINDKKKQKVRKRNSQITNKVNGKTKKNS